MLIHLISSKVISHGVKLSQKQRKMIAMTTKENSSGMNSMETASPAPSKTPKPGNAWYALNSIKINRDLCISLQGSSWLLGLPPIFPNMSFLSLLFS